MNEACPKRLLRLIYNCEHAGDHRRRFEVAANSQVGGSGCLHSPTPRDQPSRLAGQLSGPGFDFGPKQIFRDWGRNLEHFADDLLPFLLERKAGKGGPRHLIPIAGVTQIPFFAVQIPVHPSSLGTGRILDEFMGFFPITLRVMPKRH